VTADASRPFAHPLPTHRHPFPMPMATFSHCLFVEFSPSSSFAVSFRTAEISFAVVTPRKCCLGRRVSFLPHFLGLPSFQVVSCTVEGRRHLYGKVRERLRLLWSCRRLTQCPNMTSCRRVVHPSQVNRGPLKSTSSPSPSLATTC